MNIGKEKSTLLRRYTDLPELIHMLINKRLVFKNPNKWKDKNDSYYFNKFLEHKRKEGINSIYALCFMESPETSHSWESMASSQSGVCIVFLKDVLIEGLSRNKNITHKKVEYFRVRELKDAGPRIEDFPFSKRITYKCENEYRFIYAGREEYSTTGILEIDFPFESIIEIRISASLYNNYKRSLSNAIRSFLPQNSPIKINKSSLYENTGWKKYADSVLAT